MLGELASAGKTFNNSQAVRQGVQFLLSVQNGVREKALNHAHQWGMLGVMYGGQDERDRTPLHKAAKLLINAQMDDGDFPQQEITGVYMKNCMLHYAQYRNIFPLWAFGEYRKHVWVSPNKAYKRKHRHERTATT